MRVEAVNTGQRPIILTVLGYNYASGARSGMYIGKEPHKGIRLGENEVFTEDLDTADSFVCREGDVAYASERPHLFSRAGL